MRNLFAAWYALFLIAGLFGLVQLRLNGGALLLLSFEGDAVHLAQIADRMADGQVPGIDFVTPLGVMAFLPIVWLMQAGLGLGAAMAYAPGLIGAVCLPFVWWLGLTRLPIWGALGFGMAVLMLLLSLLHGGLSPTVTVSMYYNNWCWAVAMIVVLAAATRVRGDGWVVALACGLGMAFLTLVKAPYAVYLLPAVVLGLAGQGAWRALAGGVVVALLALAAVTLPLGGLAYWQGYTGDLITVATSPVRASPGKDIGTMAIGPSQILAVLGWLAAVILLRQARRSWAALVTLLLGAGFIAITHQNWQNDPHWVVIFGLLLVVEARHVTLLNRWGWPLRGALQTVATVFFALGAPALYAQGQSLLIHSALDATGFVALVPGDPSLRVKDPATEVAQVKVPHPGLARAPVSPTVLAGETLPDCEKETGLVVELQSTGAALDRLVETSGRTALYADWVNALWLWSSLAPLPGGMPWYYGGAAGFDAADYLVVPLCPMSRSIRSMVLEQVAKSGLEFAEVARTDLMIVLERRR